MLNPLTPNGNRPMVTPIVTSVNYEYSSFEILKQISDREIEGYTYHRDDNPTVRAVEDKIAKLEGAEKCIITTSGMSACAMIYFTFLKTGDHIILFHDLYGAHYKISLILERMGIDITWLDANETDDIEKHITDKTRMLFCETPSNPLCKIIDIRKTADILKKHDILFVVDNTFATPWHQKPLSLGSDISVHSATKALAGHNDLMAGAIACSSEAYEKFWYTRQAIGSTLDAFSASLLERGLKTFELRAEKMADNAMKTALFLESCNNISNISYPGLESHPGHETAARQMKNGFGGLLSFDVGNNQEDAKKFISSLTEIYHAVSLGATESLVCIPFLTTMLYLPPERRTGFGVNLNTVRMSVGIEDCGVLITDIENALKAVC